MENFTPFPSFAGGLLIGVSASAVLIFNGRVAGISGILGGALTADRRDTPWRWAFLAGLVAGGGLLRWFAPHALAIDIDRSLVAVVAAGLLVGFGTRLGNGCTSGHGVCGISRGSPRSLLATVVFMATGAAVVFVVNHVFGGSL